MDYLRNLRDNIQVADRLSLLALVVVIVMVLANVLFAWRFVLPAWRRGTSGRWYGLYYQKHGRLPAIR